MIRFTTSISALCLGVQIQRRKLFSWRCALSMFQSLKHMSLYNSTTRFVFQNYCQNIFRIHWNRSCILLRWHVISSRTFARAFSQEAVSWFPFFQDWMVWSQTTSTRWSQQIKWKKTENPRWQRENPSIPLPCYIVFSGGWTFKYPHPNLESQSPWC